MSGANNISPAIEQACRAITALLTKLEHAAEKTIQYRCSIGQHIVAIKKARPNDWLKVVKVECSLRRAQAYHYLSLVNGTSTVEKQRAANAAANKRLRKRQRAQKASCPSRDGQGSLHPDPQARADDIGPTSTSKVARKDAELDELRNAKRRLEIRVAGLESEIEDLKHENAELRQQLAATQRRAA
jgi:hypothetical protein